MKIEDRYTDAPKEVAESLARSIQVEDFLPTPEELMQHTESKRKKQVNLYLSVGTIEKFKRVAKENGGKYQTMISDLLDACTESHMRELIK